MSAASPSWWLLAHAASWFLLQFRTLISSFCYEDGISHFNVLRTIFSNVILRVQFGIRIQKHTKFTELGSDINYKVDNCGKRRKMYPTNFDPKVTCAIFAPKRWYWHFINNYWAINNNLLISFYKFGTPMIVIWTLSFGWNIRMYCCWKRNLVQ